jgi:orotate phosphoribosyltransferase
MIDEKIYNDLHAWVKSYIDEKCIIRNTVMPGKLPGTTYTWIFYLRRGLFNHEFLSAVAQMFYYKVEKDIGHFNFQIAGLETASTPMLSSFPIIGRIFKKNINAFSIRKEKKEYGLRNWIEGIPNDKPVLLIDDLCNSSNSLLKAKQILENEKLTVLNYAFVLVNKTVHIENTEDKYLKSNIKMISLFNLNDFKLKYD